MTHDPRSSFRNIADIPAYWATRQPDASALVDEGVVTSYGQLQRLIDAARRLIEQHGVASGDRVMIVGENSAELVAFLFATAAVGAWPMPVNARMASREIDALRSLAQPRLSVFTARVSPDARRHAERSGTDHVHACIGDVPVMLCPHLSIPETHDQDLDAEVGLLLATSGTTGVPKAVMIPHAGLLHFCAISVAERRLLPSDKVTALLPMSHIFGVATQLLATMYGGASLRIERVFSAKGLYDAVACGAVTMVFGVPIMFRRLLEAATEAGKAASLPQALRYAYVGAAALESELKHEFERSFGCTLQHGWGMTEYAGSMFITRADRPREGPTAGYVNAGCEARFVGPDGRDAEPGHVGEIWIRGPGLMRGYFRAPELTMQSMRDGGWFNTGDLGRLAEDGALFLVGRSKDMIIRSGFNVYPAEVEAALNVFPGIMQSCVMGARQADGNEEVVAVVEWNGGTPPDSDELVNWLRDRLSPYKVPTRWKFLDALPTLSNGKLARHKLREQLVAGEI